MIEVEQEESSAPVAAVEVESPAQPTPQAVVEKLQEAVAEVKDTVVRGKRTVRNAVTEVKTAAETAKVAISAEEHNI